VTDKPMTERTRCKHRGATHQPSPSPMCLPAWREDRVDVCVSESGVLSAWMHVRTHARARALPHPRPQRTHARPPMQALIFGTCGTVMQVHKQDGQRRVGIVCLIPSLSFPTCCNGFHDRLSGTCRYQCIHSIFGAHGTAQVDVGEMTPRQVPRASYLPVCLFACCPSVHPSVRRSVTFLPSSHVRSAIL
jgi:hypothetical protein